MDEISIMDEREALADLTRHKMATKTTNLSSLYTVYQSYGQILATFKHASTPKRGCEVFIKHVKEDTLLQDILEFALQAGQLFQIRLFTEFSGYLRSFCFVTYFSVRDARKASLILNGTLLNGQQVVVKVSYDNNCLEVRNIPRELRLDQLKQHFNLLIGTGLKELRICKFSADAKVKKCLLQYDTHKNALEARKKLYPKFRIYESNIMEIDWATPEELKTSCRLYFRTLPKSVTKLELYESLIRYIRVEGMLNMFLQQGLGYLLFISQFEAYQALLKLSRKKICGEYLEFSFSRFLLHLKPEDADESIKEETLSDISTYGETAQKPTNVNASYCIGNPICLDQQGVIDACEPFNKNIQTQTSFIQDDPKLFHNFQITSSVPALSQAPSISISASNLQQYLSPFQTPTSGDLSNIYKPVLITRPPFAVPASPLSTLSGYGATLPAMTTPLPTPLPNCYYFSNCLRPQSQGNPNTINYIQSQAFPNLVNPQPDQLHEFYPDNNEVQPSISFFPPNTWYTN
ncbi:unnamed protein product [Acanthoscelides obtectus]|uniref:RRM domain-containing protein n=1 Tax=Acanthoscelides obtectus TaxID=200917 RepID=A0A9P0K344_ACAOB|nr:unnamed protein product [Acanthoscelides obtectus]CAK1640377.1 APOBEC1 complementation factor [Acanthoscelides obtectus]